MGNRIQQLEALSSTMDGCLECGNCTFWCPMYDVHPVEPSVARGKIQLIHAVMKGELDWNEEITTALTMCTLCMACEEHCPSKCDVPSIITAARADKAMAQGFDKKLVSTSGYYRTGRFLAAKKDMTKEKIADERFLRETIPYINTPKTGTETTMRVGYFVGCTTNFLFPDMGERIIDLLVRNGVEVVVPREQGCCGSPALLRVGDFETAKERADLNVRIFDKLDYVITGCPTCAATMRKYVRFLADTPERRKAYREFAGKVFEIVGFLADILRLPASAYQTAREAKGKRITWHDPCHLSRHLGVRNQPRQILRGLKDIDYVEMARADWCCGNAGIFSETHFELSSKIADKKAEAIEASDASIVVTSCPGCMLQLENAIRKNEMSQKVMHIVELIG